MGLLARFRRPEHGAFAGIYLFFSRSRAGRSDNVRIF
jgi:hypothetical protein